MRRSTTALRAGLGALLFAATHGLVACGDDSADDGTRATSSPAVSTTSASAPESSSSREPTAGPEPTPYPKASSTVPQDLVGTWIASDSGRAEMIYVFSPDGTYKHASVLVQRREAGIFKFTIGARGTVTVDGQSMVLRPKTGTQEVQDPSLPSRNAKRPIERSPQRYKWTIDPSQSRARLRLTDASGLTIAYIKQ